MKNISFGMKCCFLTIYTIFGLCSNLPFLSIPVLAQNLPPPKVETGEATDVTSSSATLNGEVSGRAPSAWFEYGTTSDMYDGMTLASWDGLGTDTVSSNISELSAATTYYYRIAAYDSDPEFTTDNAYGSEKSFTTLAAIPTVTPTPECEIESIDTSPKTLKLKREESGDVTVTVTCADGSPIVSEMVTAKIKLGKKCISVSPLSAYTDTNGQAVFTVAAKNKTGNSKVTFKANSLKELVIVKVRK